MSYHTYSTRYDDQLLSAEMVVSEITIMIGGKFLKEQSCNFIFRYIIMAENLELGRGVGYYKAQMIHRKSDNQIKGKTRNRMGILMWVGSR